MFNPIGSVIVVVVAGAVTIPVAAVVVYINNFICHTFPDYVDINDVDNCGSTALHIAIENGHKVALEYLIRHGGDTSLLDGRNRTPLHLAVELNKHELLDVSHSSEMK